MPDIFLLFDLFINFFKIGIFTFGGGYAMISLIIETVLDKGWCTEEAITEYIAVAQSAPGPFALNAAVFVGMNQAGPLGIIAVTFGLILPPFILILIIAKFLSKVSEYQGVSAAMTGINPAVIGLIISSAVITLAIPAFDIIIDFKSNILNFDLTQILIFAVVLGLSMIKKLKIESYKIILVSAALGIIIYSVRDFMFSTPPL